MSSDETPPPASRDDLPPPEPPLDAILVPSAGFGQEAPPAGITPSLPRPPSSVSRVARPPHPGFWFSLLGCIGFVIVTQLPGAIVAILILMVAMVGQPGLLGQAENQSALQTALMKSPTWSLAMAVAFFINEVLVVGISWLVIRLIVGREWPRRLALRRPGLVHVALVLASLPAMILLADGGYAVIKILWEDLRQALHFRKWDVPGMEEMVQVFNRWPPAFAVLVIGLGPGIGEELWCRGFLGRGLVGRYGWWGVVATAFYFGLIHLDPVQGPMAMLMGLWLHFVYLTTRSLLMPMLLHFLNNSVAVVSSHFTALAELEQRPGGIPPYVFAGAALLLLAVGFALYQSRARLAAVIGDGPPLWQPPFPGVEYPPASSGTRVIHPPPSFVATLAAFAAFVAFLACCWAAYRSG
jgi:membrane protease YdiL (CAAX protease family)